MRRFARWFADELRNAPTRKAFRNEQMGLMNEILRVCSFALGGVFAAILIDEAARVLVIVSLAGLGFFWALLGLRKRGRRPQAPSAFLDLLISPVIVGIATGSVAISAAVGVFVAALMWVSFDMDVRIVVIGVALGSVVTIVGVGALGTPQRNSISIAVAVFVASVLVVAGGLMLLEWAQARKALVSREAELRTILTRTPVMLCTLDAVGVIESVTGAVPDAKWVPGAEAVKVMPDDLVDLVEHAMAGSRSTGDIEVGDRFLDVTCERSATGVIITGFDVTERQAARTELEQLIRTKDEFVASISHELRTPLTAVLGFTEELRRIGAVDEEGRPYLDVVAEQSAEMAAIIEDLLVAVRADLDIFTVVENPLRLEGEARVVLRSLEPRVTKPIRIDDGAAVVIGDSGRVRQIIRNLIINADRYGGDHVEIRISRVDGMGVIEVCDDGAPIEDELRERIFLAYESTGRVQGRTAALGLGLSVSRRLANLMGGSLEYDHRDGWSVFRLALPAAHRPLAALPHAERAHSTPPAAGGGLIEAAG